ncbi:MAG: RNA methyltransferase [Bacteroidia bacterium]|nr:RNA methyltransferase [Bacteroidia bacterium]
MEAPIVTDLRALRRALENGVSAERIVWRQGTAPPPALWQLIKRYSIPFQQVPPSALPVRKAKWAAYLSPLPLASMQAWLGVAPQGIAVAALGITDVRNVGALLRSAAAFGVKWVLLKSEGSPLLSSEGIWRSSAGALAHLNIVREPRALHALQSLRSRGWRLVATVPPSYEATPYTEYNWHEPSILLFGDEEKGLPEIYLQLCDVRLTIPHLPIVESLNVSVAAGILLATAYARSLP